MWLPLINMFQPFDDLFTGRSKAAFFCWHFFVCVSHVSSLCLLGVTCSFMITGLERIDLLTPLHVMLLFCFFSFPYGLSGTVWYLIVSIPEVFLSLCFQFLG